MTISCNIEKSGLASASRSEPISVILLSLFC
jgi:hypothetical protein